MFPRCADAQKAASFGVIPVGVGSPFLPSLTRSVLPHPRCWACNLHAHSLAVRAGRIFPLPTFWMFSQNSQFFDYTHIVRLNVTFPTGDCPAWVQLLHMVFLFVLEKAPDTFGQSSSCWLRCWGHCSPTWSRWGCSR